MLYREGRTALHVPDLTLRMGTAEVWERLVRLARLALTSQKALSHLNRASGRCGQLIARSTKLQQP